MTVVANGARACDTKLAAATEVAKAGVRVDLVETKPKLDALGSCITLPGNAPARRRALVAGASRVALGCDFAFDMGRDYSAFVRGRRLPAEVGERIASGNSVVLLLKNVAK
ncbi:MAG: hypothetical protein J0H70_08745 [Microbacterium chocolatum]|nr:hypothetical protein [Microbacterium chocolatum]